LVPFLPMLGFSKTSMKTIVTRLWICCGMLFFFSTAFALSYELDKTSHDFGAIPQYGNCTCDFVLTNTGSTPLLVTSARTSCGCDVGAFTREPIAPGQSTKVNYRYDSSRIGPWRKYLSLDIHGEKDPVLLCISGYVYDTSRENQAEIKRGNSTCSCPGTKSQEPVVPVVTPAIEAYLPTAPVEQPIISESLDSAESIVLEMDTSMLDSNAQVLQDLMSKHDVAWELSVFPNPLRTLADIHWNYDVVNGILILHNMQGQVIREARNIRGRSVEWTDLDLSSGTYILTLYQNEQALGTFRCIVH
jgi:hypothetical protein